MVLDGVALNDDVTYSLESLSMPSPKKKPEWVAGADTDGAVLGRDPLFENREIQVRVRAVQQASMDLALAKVAAISDKLEEAERNLNGIPLTWTPADSTKTVTFRVLSGEISELPITPTGDDAGWFVRSPVVTLVMTTRPFGYGAEVTGTAVSSTEPVLTLEASAVAGDVPAEGRLIVTDAATQSRRHFEWGLESRHYPTVSPPGLLVDSASLVTSGYSGAATTRTGAYSASGVIRATLYSLPTVVCATQDLSHIGTFRVKARVYGTGANSGTSKVFVRLAWRVGEGQFYANAYDQPRVVNGFSEIDLGLITIPQATLGTQKWLGQIQAYSLRADGTYDTLDVDYLALIPAGEGYGKSHAVYSTGQIGVLSARDDFASMTSGALLGGRTAPLGGAWATSGDATDFEASDVVSPGDMKVRRSAVSSTAGRYALVGTTSFSNVDVAASVGLAGISAAAANPYVSVVARYVDANNHLRVSLNPQNSELRLWARVAGADTLLASQPVAVTDSTFYRLRLVCFATGGVIAEMRNARNTLLASVQAQSTHLQAGGALATGLAGIHDISTAGTLGVTRYFDDVFVTATPPAEEIVIYSGRQLEVRGDGDEIALRQNAGGTLWGRPPLYRGSPILVPPAGTAARKTRVLVKARRNDIETSADEFVADNLTAQLNYTPRYLAVPR